MSPFAESSGGSRPPEQPGAADGPGRRAEQPEPSEGPDGIQIPWARGGSSGGQMNQAKEGREEAEVLSGDSAEALATAKRERDEYLEMLRRVQADFENYKKRMMRQQSELLERAAQGIVLKLLPALDAFDLARGHLSETEELSDEGKALLQASALLFDALAKEGLERVDDSGKPFDPTVHEAVEHVSADDPADGSSDEAIGDAPVVVSVLRPGYRWKGRVIRPAMVRVRG